MSEQNPEPTIRDLVDEIARLRSDVISLQDSIGRQGFIVLGIETQTKQMRRDVHDIKSAVLKS